MVLLEAPEGRAIVVAEREHREARKVSDQPAQGVGEAPAAAAKPGDVALASVLVATRERRGLSHSEVTRQTRIPEHYLRMLESDNYAMVSDQLYLLPFLRRYAAFLGLDEEDLAMRFVREVQRVDGIPAKFFEPRPLTTRRPVPWKPIAALALAALAILLIVALRARRGSQAHTSAVAPANSTSIVESPGTAASGTEPAGETQPATN